MAATTRTSTLRERVATDAIELLVLQHLQELRLEARVHLADLVEEDRAVVGQLELARLLGVALR